MDTPFRRGDYAIAITAHGSTRITGGADWEWRARLCIVTNTTREGKVKRAQTIALNGVRGEGTWREVTCAKLWARVPLRVEQVDPVAAIVADACLVACSYVGDVLDVLRPAVAPFMPPGVVRESA